MEEQKFCSSCGSLIKGDDKYCPNCGKPVNGTSTQTFSATNTNCGQKYNYSSSSLAIASLVMGILSLFFFGLIFGILAICFGYKEKDTDTKAKTGFILGIIGIVGWAIIFFFYLLLLLR